MFRPALSTERVEAFLRDRFGAVRDVARLGSGEWSVAFAFSLPDGQARVARFGPVRGDYEKDRLAAGFAAPPQLCVPEILEIGEAFGGAWALSSRAYGVGFDALDASGYRHVLPALLDLLDALRRVDLSGTTGYGMWSAAGTAPHASFRDAVLDVEHDRAGDRTHGWKRRLYAVPEAARRFEASLCCLRSLVDACPCDRHLIHADLMGDNVLVQGDRITAVVDWGNAMFGDCLYDLARLTFWAAWFPELERIDLHGLARERFADEPDFAARLRCCQVHVGLDAQAYNAFTRRWRELERSGERTLALARS